MTTAPLRLVQWTTGNISREAVKGILERPDRFELVGVFAYSEDKVGKDLGELCGLDRVLGVVATNDIAEIIALEPDCVVHMPLHPNVDHMVQLLRAGINIATTAHFMSGRAYGEEDRARLQAAAVEGGASLFGSGINPGYAQYLAATATNVCRSVNHVRIVESFDIGSWAADANQDEIGWGRPAGDPGHAADIEHATIPFGDTCEALAGMLDLELDDIRCDVEFAHAVRDLDVPGRDVRTGSVAGVYARWIGSAAGHDVVECAVRWTVSPYIEPSWEIAMAYQIEVRGYPNVTVRAEVLPDIGSMSMDEMVGMGSVITAMPLVHAIPSVVAARPGIVGYEDLTSVSSRLVPAAAVAPDEPAPAEPGRFTRQSTLLELESTRTGRALKKMIGSQARKTASNDREGAMFANMASYMTVEKVVRMSDGKLSWAVADSILDLANGKPGRILARGASAGRSAIRKRRPRR